MRRTVTQGAVKKKFSGAEWEHASTQATCPQGTWSGDLSHCLSEVQASQTQLEPSTLVPSCLRIELDQGFHSGSGSARQGLSSTSCSFRVNADSGNQSFFQELVLTPSTTMKNPPQMEDDPLEGSSNTQWHQVTGNIHGSSASKPKKTKIKVQFSKWIRWPSRSGCTGTK
ncbi:Neuroblastoma breakpoint member 4 [Saguinus oedipus]|uniref:Neuroblastoma breakpoint member 4 n=1 Tax=Saguinus oedipus TaxID=9490 RepID=A0ABQ9VCA5_SAGOE|nr:Neuroblastoma breakpoint member 4 [Saguinus oedipus]